MRVFVIGNATLDESFILSRLPQPGESLVAAISSRCLGGKGANQAIILARCGIDTTLITAIADDTRGQEIQHWLEREPLCTKKITPQNCGSDQSVLLTLPEGENSVISTTAAAAQLSLVNVSPLLSSARAYDLLVLQGNLSYQTTLDLLVFARTRKLFTCFNPSPVQRGFINLWPWVDVMFLNEVEAMTLTSSTGSAAVQYLMDQGVGQIILTHGAEGAWSGTDQHIEFTQAKRADAVDTTGAGDTFMAVAIASSCIRCGDVHSAGIDRVAIEHAHQAAAITVSKPGTVSAFPTREELDTLLKVQA